jgi:hypothetical protein
MVGRGSNTVRQQVEEGIAIVDAEIKDYASNLGAATRSPSYPVRNSLAFVGFKNFLPAHTIRAPKQIRDQIEHLLQQAQIPSGAVRVFEEPTGSLQPPKDYFKIRFSETKVTRKALDRLAALLNEENAKVEKADPGERAERKQQERTAAATTAASAAR